MVVAVLLTVMVEVLFDTALDKYCAELVESCGETFEDEADATFEDMVDELSAGDIVEEILADVVEVGTTLEDAVDAETLDVVVEDGRLIALNAEEELEALCVVLVADTDVEPELEIADGP